ncbi:MAG: PAS domain S-box protein [Ignavibacteriales bacterium]|jgi:PAS domain S-box-containing protein|nr:PAS domain S-box protein [Ignavibacteriales bacterium]
MPGDEPRTYTTEELIARVRELEAAARQTEERRRVLAEKGGELVYRFALPERECVYVGALVEEIFGLRAEEILADPDAMRSRVHPEDRPEFDRRFKDAETGNLRRHYDFRALKPDGSVRWLRERDAIVTDRDGKITALDCVATDVTDRRKTEERLRDVEFRYRAIFETIGSATVILEPSGVVSLANPAAAELTGYPASMIERRMHWADFALPEDHELFRKFLRLAKMRGKRGVETAEARVRVRSGEVRGVEAKLAPLERAGALVVSLTDVTDRIARQRELADLNTRLRASERELKATVAERDKFMSIIAHDLKGPFSALLTFSDFLAKDLPNLSDEEIEEFAQNIHVQLKSLYSLIENLLQWSRLQTGRMEIKPRDLDAKTLIEDVVEVYQFEAERRELRLRVEAPRNLSIFADRETVSAALRNLVSNAMKFTEAGGKIVVSVADRGEWAEISVADTGKGISNEDQLKLFRLDVSHSTPGVQNEKGTGLGLILCKEFVEKNGGKIWMESEEGVGATVSFTLPKSRDEEQPPA